MDALKGGLVVSCQAPVESPLHNPLVIAAMAAASINQGAVGVRIDTPAHIETVRTQINAPIIGLWKQVIPGSEVYITPQFHHAQAVAAAGADIVAVDATPRPRPGNESLERLIRRIHEELGKPVMADVDTFDNAIAAAAVGADYVGTTLYGYTSETCQLIPPDFDLLAALVERLAVPIICEGGVASPEEAAKALQLGAFCVVVGTAITGVDRLVERYVASMASSR